MKKMIGHITNLPIPDQSEFIFNVGAEEWQPKTSKHKRYCKARSRRNKVASKQRKINRLRDKS